jgi:hypothetical protein
VAGVTLAEKYAARLWERSGNLVKPKLTCPRCGGKRWYKAFECIKCDHKVYQ